MDPLKRRPGHRRRVIPNWLIHLDVSAANLTLPHTQSGALGIQADAASAFHLNGVFPVNLAPDFVAGSVKADVKPAPVGAELYFTRSAVSNGLAVAHRPSGEPFGGCNVNQIGNVTAMRPTPLASDDDGAGNRVSGANISVFVNPLNPAAAMRAPFRPVFMAGSPLGSHSRGDRGPQRQPGSL